MASVKLVKRPGRAYSPDAGLRVAGPVEYNQWAEFDEIRPRALAYRLNELPGRYNARFRNSALPRNRYAGRGQLRAGGDTACRMRNRGQVFRARRWPTLARETGEDPRADTRYFPVICIGRAANLFFFSGNTQRFLADKRRSFVTSSGQVARVVCFVIPRDTAGLRERRGQSRSSRRVGVALRQQLFDGCSDHESRRTHSKLNTTYSRFLQQ